MYTGCGDEMVNLRKTDSINEYNYRRVVSHRPQSTFYGLLRSMSAPSLDNHDDLRVALQQLHREQQERIYENVYWISDFHMPFSVSFADKKITLEYDKDLRGYPAGNDEANALLVRTRYDSKEIRTIGIIRYDAETLLEKWDSGFTVAPQGDWAVGMRRDNDVYAKEIYQLAMLMSSAVLL